MGSVFFRTEEEEMLIVTNEDVHDDTREVSVEVFTQDEEDCLQFNWQGSETFNRECYTATSIPTVSLAERESFPDGISLSEGQFEELISNTDVSGGDNNESDSDDDETEQIARCDLPARSRRSRMVKPPARL